MACGFLPKVDGAIPPVPDGYNGGRPTHCPGYYLHMPQVQEASRAAYWRDKGSLREFYDGEELVQLTKDGIDIISSAQQEVQNYRTREAYKKD